MNLCFTKDIYTIWGLIKESRTIYFVGKNSMNMEAFCKQTDVHWKTDEHSNLGSIYS